MITRIRIENYKALRDVTIDLTPIHVLIGPNDSGKTSILEAVNALCRSVDLPLNDAFAGAWKGRELVNSMASDPVVTITAHLNGEDAIVYALSVRFRGSKRNAFRFGELGSGAAQWSDPPVDDLGASWVMQEHGSGGPLEPDIERVHAALSGAHLYRWDPRLLALPNAPDAKRRFRMEPSGFGLALMLDEILGFDRDRFADMEHRFESIFPEIRAIRLLPEPAYRAAVDASRPIPLLKAADGKGIYFQPAAGNGLIPASQASEGVLLVLAYLAILSLPEPPRVVLIEEPENGIHPSRLEQVLRILRDLVSGQRHTQVLLTTHSPYILDLFSPEEVTLCRKSDNGQVTAHRLSSSKSVREQLDVFSLGEIWTAEGDEKIAASADGGAG